MSAQVKDDGGPAFPTRGEDFIDGPQGRHPQSAWGMEPKSGMTLRDYFAAKAMQALLARHDVAASSATRTDTAVEAWRMADAMLETQK